MTVHVEFYSVLRDAVGCDEMDLTVADGSTIGDLLGALFEKFPKLAPWDTRLLLAADLDYVDRSHVLRENQIVSVMPPVQGG